MCATHFRGVLVCLALLGVVPVFAAQTKPADKPKPAMLSAAEKELIDLMNEERAREKLPPLKPSDKLMLAARNHAQNMAKQEKGSHVLDDKTPIDRAKDVGYAFRQLGENWASGQKTNALAIKQWMDSPPHRANILKKEFTEIGVGIAKSAKGKLYYCQLFGTPQ
jgi:uncharacterized protein YkwD